MLVSILHRATGIGLSTVGALLMVWWLAAAAAGPDAYATFRSVMTSWLGLIVLVGLTWVFFLKLAAGLRHLYMDTGAGFELGANKRSAALVLVASVVLTLITWALIALR